MAPVKNKATGIFELFRLQITFNVEDILPMDTIKLDPLNFLPGSVSAAVPK